MSKDQQELDTIKAELAELGGRLKKLGSEASDVVAESARNLAKQLPANWEEYSGKAEAKIKEGVATAKDATLRTVKKADDYAKENPWRVAAIAAGVSALVAGIAGARRKRDK